MDQKEEGQSWKAILLPAGYGAGSALWKPDAHLNFSASPPEGLGVCRHEQIQFPACNGGSAIFHASPPVSGNIHDGTHGEKPRICCEGSATGAQARRCDANCLGLASVWTGGKNRLATPVVSPSAAFLAGAVGGRLQGENIILRACYSRRFIGCGRGQQGDIIRGHAYATRQDEQKHPEANCHS